MPTLLKETKARSSSIVPRAILKPTRETLNIVKEIGVQKGFVEPMKKKTQVRFQEMKKSLKQKVMDKLESLEDKWVFYEPKLIAF